LAFNFIKQILTPGVILVVFFKLEREVRVKEMCGRGFEQQMEQQMEQQQQQM